MIKPSGYEIGIGEQMEFNKRRLEKIRRELERLPQGTLQIYKRGDKRFFYANNNGKRTGITKDKDRVYDLARAKYLRECQKIYKKEQAWARNALKHLEKIHTKQGVDRLFLCMKRLEDAGLEVERIFNSKQQYKWRNEQSMNPGFREDLRWESERGIAQRSKSENKCDDQGDKFHLPMRYEYGLKVDVTELGFVSNSFKENGRRYKIYYPDFVILLADGSIIIWEHLGMIHKETYRNDVGERICAYLSSGIIDIDHLVLTFEGDLRDPHKLKNLINSRILPYV